MKKAVAKGVRGDGFPDSMNQTLKKTEKLVSISLGKYNSYRSASSLLMLRHERKFKPHSQMANYKSIAAGWNGANIQEFRKPFLTGALIRS